MVEDHKKHNSDESNQSHERAIASFTKDIELNPTDAEAYYGRGVSYYEIGKYDQAIIDLNKSISLNPYNSYAFFARGEIYKILGQDEKANADKIYALAMYSARNKRLGINIGGAGKSRRYMGIYYFVGFVLLTVLLGISYGWWTFLLVPAVFAATLIGVFITTFIGAFTTDTPEVPDVYPNLGGGLVLLGAVIWSIVEVSI